MNLRLSEAFLEQLDRVRGDVPREVWIRRVLEVAVAGGLEPRPVVERSPGPPVEIEAPRESPGPPKEARLEIGRRVLSKPVQPRPIIQKRGG